jgi:hypothetical protein
MLVEAFTIIGALCTASIESCVSFRSELEACCPLDIVRVLSSFCVLLGLPLELGFTGDVSCLKPFSETSVESGGIPNMAVLLIHLFNLTN